MVVVTGPAVAVFPALLVASAVNVRPSVSTPVVKAQLPEASIVAAPKSVEPSNTRTDDTPSTSLTVPDRVSVSSFVRPPLVIVAVRPVVVPIVELIVSLGGTVSTIAVTTAVVVALPAVSVAVAVKL